MQLFKQGRCAAAILLIAAATTAASAEQAQDAVPQPCYPGLPCPGGNIQADEPPPSAPQQTDYPAPRGSSIHYHYVGPLAPPDPWLALRSEPSGNAGYRIMKMPAGTLLRQLERRGFWWYVELTTGERGWAHSKWIKCCKTVSVQGRAAE